MGLCRRLGLSAVFIAALAIGAGLLADPAAAGGGWTWPVAGDVITQYRNGADPYAGGQHRGIDVAAEAGAPVVAAVSGTVRFAGVAGSSGLTVSVRTADGRLDTSYLHLSSADVGEGDRVGAGERIGAVGTSGRRSAERSHLHFGVRDTGSRHAYRDPLDFLPPPPVARPAPEPRGAPAPVAAPVPVAPAPERVRSPVPVRSPRSVRAPQPVRIPSLRPFRVPVGARFPVRGGAPDTTPRHVPQVGPRLAPIPAAAPGEAALGREGPPRPAGVLDGVPWLEGVHGLDAAAAPAPQGSPLSRRAAETGAPGPDIGWALACAGLLLAAACLGRPGGRSRGDGHGRVACGSASGGLATLRSLLRPLTGGR